MNLPHSASHSSLDLFDNLTVLDPILWSNVQEKWPTNSLNEGVIEFEFGSLMNEMIDLQETYFKVELRFQDLVNFGIKEDLEDDEKTDAYVNNLMHSLFSNAEVYFNNTQVYNSNGLYAHKAYISNEISHTKGVKDGIIFYQGYQYEPNPDAFNEEPILSRKEIVEGSKPLAFFGKLAIDVFTCDKYLLPGTKVRVRLIRSEPNFVMLNESNKASKYRPVITRATLLTRHVSVHESAMRQIKAKLSREPARYTYSQVLTKTTVIPAGLYETKIEAIFGSHPIRRLALAMNTNSGFRGAFQENPYHYQRFGLHEIKIIRGNQTLVSLNTEHNAQPYVTTMNALKFDTDGPNIPPEDYDNHYILVFDLTATQEAQVQMYFSDIVGTSIRLELSFREALPTAIEVLMLGETLSTICIDKDGTCFKRDG